MIFLKLSSKKYDLKLCYFTEELHSLEFFFSSVKRKIIVTEEKKRREKREIKFGK